jgi:PAS domain S-box-containing protein
MRNEIIKVFLIHDQWSEHSYLVHLLTEIERYPYQFEVEPIEVSERPQNSELLLRPPPQEGGSVILLDLSLPSEQAIPVIHTIQEQTPNVPIVVLLPYECSHVADQIVDLGSECCLVKQRLTHDSLAQALICAIEQQRLRAQLHLSQQRSRNKDARFQDLINRNADGIIVVDANGIVRFVNPAAEELFGQSAEELLGELFGFPIVAGETAEIDTFKRGEGYTRIAEMRVVEVEWEGEQAYLMSLRDITEHKMTEEALREAEYFNRSILNSIDAHIVVIDQEGTIVAVNNSWKKFVRESGTPTFEHAVVGTNYFEACRKAFGKTSHVLKGIMSVLRGERSSFDIDYPYHTSSGEHQWFHMHVMLMVGSKQRRAVVAHNNVTERKRAARAEAEAASNADRIKEQEREIQALLQLSTKTSSTVTSGLFGAPPLHENAPHLFDKLTGQYGHLVDLAMEQRAFRVEHDLSDRLRSMAEQLGFLRASPRDVVKLHSVVLQEKSSLVNPLKARAYVEEGRLLVLELMGYLVSYYRNFSLGMSKSLLQDNQEGKS